MTLKRTALVATLALCTAIAAAPARAQPAAAASAANDPGYVPSAGQAGKDVIWLPTSQSLVDRMLEMAELKPDDHLVDLGSGDGRLVITAAKRGATARGIEYNPDLVALSIRTAAAEGVAARTHFEKADLFESDFSNATVVTMFLLPKLNLRLRPILLAMKPGTRIVSNSFDMDEWSPDATEEVTSDCSTYCQAYRWTVPAQVEGNWRLGDGAELALQQRFQMLEGTLRRGGQLLPVSEARMHGTQIRFTAGGESYTGQWSERQLQGTMNGGARTWRAVPAPG